MSLWNMFLKHFKWNKWRRKRSKFLFHIFHLKHHDLGSESIKLYNLRTPKGSLRDILIAQVTGFATNYFWAEGKLN